MSKSKPPTWGKVQPEIGTEYCFSGVVCVESTSQKINGNYLTSPKRRHFTRAVLIEIKAGLATFLGREQVPAKGSCFKPGSKDYYFNLSLS